MNVKVLKTIHEGLRSKGCFDLKQAFRGLGFELMDKLKKSLSLI